MPTQAPQIGQLLIGEVANVAIDCSGFLDSGETITGTVTVEEQSTSDLTISSEQVNGSTITINGASVSAGYAVQCRVDTTGASAREYSLMVSVVTSAGQTRKGLVALVVS